MKDIYVGMENTLDGIMMEVRQYCQELNLIPEETKFGIFSGAGEVLPGEIVNGIKELREKTRSAIIRLKKEGYFKKGRVNLSLIYEKIKGDSMIVGLVLSQNREKKHCNSEWN